jgi:hypothetical protein
MTARIFALLVFAAGSSVSVAVSAPTPRAAAGRVARAPHPTDIPHTLVVEGRVVDPQGSPIPGAHLLVDAPQRRALPAGTTGRYVVGFEVGSVEGLARAPVSVRFRAVSRGWNILLPGAGSWLALELRTVLGPDSAARIQVRSNSGALASALADSIAAGVSPLHLVVQFIGTQGPASPAIPPSLDAVAWAPAPDLRWPRSRAASPAAAAKPPSTPATGPSAVAKPPSTPATGPSAAAKPSTPATAPPSPAKPSSARVTTGSPAKPSSAPAAASSSSGNTASDPRAAALPQSPSGGRAGPPAVPAGVATTARPNGCRCDVRGTVEIAWNRPLEEGLRVVVALAEDPSLADTVVLFMGAPRPFELRGAPCGRHRVSIRTLSRRRFRVVVPSALGPFDCASDSLVQPAIVLRPR